MRGEVNKDYIRGALKFLREDVEDEVPTSIDDSGVPADDVPPETEEGEECEMVDCPDCGGTGVTTDEDGNEVTCETCGGEGCVCLEDAEFDFDPSTGVCPCCGCKLNVIEPTEDGLAGEEDLGGDDITPDDLPEEI